MGQLSQGQNREVNCDACEAELCHRYTALMRIALQKSTSWITQSWGDRYVIKYLFQGWGLSDVSKPHAKNRNYNIDQMSSTRHSFPNTNRWIRRKGWCWYFEKRFRVGRRLSKFTYEQSWTFTEPQTKNGNWLKLDADVLSLLEGRLEIVIANTHSPPALHQAHTKLRS